MRTFLCGWIGGILLLQTAAALPSLSTLSLASLLWVVPLPRYGHMPRYRPFLLFLGALLLGFTHAEEQARQRLDARLPTELDQQQRELSGTIVGLVDNTGHQSRFRFAPDPTIPGLPAVLSLALSPQAMGIDPSTLAPGQRWRWHCRLKRPHTLRNPGGFDSETWAWSEGILAYGQVDARQKAQWLGNVHPSWHGDFALLLEQARDQLRRNLMQQLGGEPQLGVLIALTLGDQSGISETEWQRFWATGVGHLVSISGLHITMLAALVGRLAALVHPSMRVRWLASLAGATGYALIAGFSLPTQRTLAMIAVVTVARLSRRPLPVSAILLLAASLTLLKDAMAPLSGSFWLSFGAVSMLVYAGALRTGRPSFWHEFNHTQWAATWATLPLGVWLFNQLAWVSPIANAFAIPLVSLIVVPLALIGLLPGCAMALHAAAQVMDWTCQLLEGLLQHSGPAWILPTPDYVDLLAAMLGTFFLLAPRGLPGRWAGSLGLLGLCAAPLPRPAPGALQLDILDVGQGLAMVVRTAHHVLVVDTGTGGPWGSDSGRHVLIPYLRSQGVRGLDGLVISHGDLDHSGGASSLLQAYPAPWILSSLPQHHPLVLHSPHAMRCIAGMHWRWDGILFEVLYPAASDWAIPSHKSNDRACVLRLNSGKRHILLPADIEERAERALLDHVPNQLRADVLIAPHHGSKTSSSPAFLEAIQPQWTLFSLGDHNRFHHPSPRVWHRYREAGVHCWRTDECGDLRVILDPDHLQVSAERQTFPHYWEKSCPAP